MPAGPRCAADQAPNSSHYQDSEQGRWCIFSLEHDTPAQEQDHEDAKPVHG